mmetsp:Transcript_18699/g.37934  ORF Transcript_18699/g.37934 Transcript_18699/m.37934 type:complete len:85 (+) Transcript_18699:117-371(+)
MVRHHAQLSSVKPGKFNPSSSEGWSLKEAQPNRQQEAREVPTKHSGREGGSCGDVKGSRTRESVSGPPHPQPLYLRSDTNVSFR